MIHVKQINITHTTMSTYQSSQHRRDKILKYKTSSEPAKPPSHHIFEIYLIKSVDHLIEKNKYSPTAKIIFTHEY